jgi:outer membrane protein assembly factor BamD
LHRTSSEVAAKRPPVAAATMRLILVLMTGLFLLSATRCEAQIFHKKKVNKSTSADNTAEPDKILYDKAMDDIKHGRHEVGRLNLQTLINTYPDSEYLAKAKLAIADSYFKEGGKANMTQAIQAYKDFIVFFPFMQEAAYAQLQVAMAHYKQMEKPDRDRTEARAAEDEFQTYLKKYPNDPLEGKAEQHLREVQEVLAEGDYRIGYYYYVKGDKKAAESRLKSVTTRYPLYSKSDQALWMLGNIWEGTEKKEFAANYYAQIVRNYPLSPLVPDAKGRLKAMGAPIPQPDPKAVAWMTAEQNAPRPHTSLVMKPLTILHPGPGQELQVASRTGKPPLEPESESSAGVETLTGGDQTRKAGGTGIVSTLVVGSNGGGTGTAEEVAPPADGSSDKSGAQTDPNSVTPAADPNKPATSDSANGAGATPAAMADAPAKSDATAPTGGDATKTDPAAGTQPTTDATKIDGTQTQNSDSSKESTSKKKKGLKKLIPW